MSDVNLMDDLISFERSEYSEADLDLVDSLIAKSTPPADSTPPINTQTEPVLPPDGDPIPPVVPDLDDDTPPAGEDKLTEPTLPPTVDPKETSEGIEEYYNFLVENNILILDEDFKFEKTAASLSEALKQSDSNRQELIAKALWDDLPDDFKPILKYGLSGGTDVETFLKTYNSNVLDVETADLTDPVVKDSVLRSYYKQTTKFSDTKIENHIAQLKERGDAAYTAEVYATAVELKDIQKTHREELTQAALLKNQAAQTKAIEEATLIQTAIDKMDTTPQRKAMIKSFIYAPDANTPSRMNTAVESILENKEHYAQLVDILVDSYDTKTGFNLEARFSKKAKNKALDDIEKQLQVKFSESKSKVSGNNSTSDAPTIDWSSIFNPTNE